MAEKTLVELYEEHKGKVSDKWSSYLFEYDRLLQPFKHQPIRLLEIGIQNGGSLDIWSKYFPNAEKFVGCDINQACANLQYCDSRITVVIGDANSDDIQKAILENSKAFDIIIDDGSHFSGDIVKSFTRYFPLLSDGGLYIAEDLHCSYFQHYEGGLFNPFTSILFFKRLADIINYDFWGVKKNRESILEGFFKKYNCEINSELLAHIHSVEFSNSMCTVRKNNPEQNHLGTRIIAGQVEAVSSGVAALSGSKLYTEFYVNLQNNHGPIKTVPPEEELVLCNTKLIKSAAENEKLIQELAACKQNLYTQQRELANAADSITNIEKTLKISEQELQICKHELDSKQKELIKASDYIININVALKTREQELANMYAELLKTGDRYLNSQKNLGTITRSLSWQATKPLRHFSQLFPRTSQVFTKGLKVTYWMATGQLKRRLQLRKLIFQVHKAGLFDANYYLHQYPDVIESGIDPLRHFCEYGLAEQRNPSASFDTTWYLRQYRDVAAAGVNPVLHYLFHGKAEGRMLPNQLLSGATLPGTKLADNVDLLSTINTQELINATNGNSVSSAFSPLNKKIEIINYVECQYGKELDFSNKKVVMLAHWDPDGIVDPYVIYYLEHFKQLGWCTIIVSAGVIQLTDTLKNVADAVLYRTCAGYDFTSWKGGFEYFPSLLAAQELILTNDSIFAPISNKSLQSLHAAMDKVNCDFWGVIASKEGTPYLQSDYLVFRKSALQHEAFTSFWQGVRACDDRNNTIRYEVTLSPWLALNELRSAVYLPVQWSNNNVTPALDPWKQLIKLGIPFFKRELLESNKRRANIDSCMAELAKSGYPIYLIANYFKRIKVTPTVPMPQYALAVEAYEKVFSGKKELTNSNTFSVLTDALKNFKSQNKIALVVHVFWSDLWPEIESCYNRFPEPTDLIVSLVQGHSEHLYCEIIKKYPRAVVLIFPNHGRDIYPFIYFLNSGILDSHQFICKLHTKKSLHLPQDAGCLWRRNLLEFLVGSEKNVSDIIATLRSDSKIAFLAPANTIVGNHYWGSNLTTTKKLARVFNIDFKPEELEYVAGSMFWGRADFLTKLKLLNLQATDFEPEAGQIDGTIAHAIERLLGILVTANHMTIAKWICSGQYLFAQGLYDPTLYTTNISHARGSKTELTARMTWKLLLTIKKILPDKFRLWLLKNHPAIIEGLKAKLLPCVYPKVTDSSLNEQDTKNIVGYSSDYLLKLKEDLSKNKTKTVANNLKIIPDIDSNKLADAISLLGFANETNPEISIILPIFTNAVNAIRCLLALEKYTAKHKIEVIIIDSLVADTAMPLLSNISNVRYYRSQEQDSLSKACNFAANIAKGEYLVICNENIQVLDNWLEPLIDTFAIKQNVGMVAGKLFSLDGLLQAIGGGKINTSGSLQLIGDKGDYNLPKYNYIREIDYCYSYCFAIKKVIFTELHGLNENFTLADYALADFAIRLRKNNLRAIYQYRTEVVYCETTAQLHDYSRTDLDQSRGLLLKLWRDDIVQLNKLRLIAFYLPQFHPIPENDVWWGKGFTEWNNVVKARPNFQGHNQPLLPADLGFYDLRIAEIMQQQAEMARKYNLSGFCYYYYWFNGKRLLEMPLERLLSENVPDFPFCLCWANETWSRRWDGSESDILIQQEHNTQDNYNVIQDLIRYFKHKNYIKINDRPVFLVYRINLFPDIKEATTIWRAECQKNGIANPYLVMVQSFEQARAMESPENFGFDAAVEFVPHQMNCTPRSLPPEMIVNKKFSGLTYNYPDAAEYYLKRTAPDYTWFRGIIPRWDNTARKQNAAFCFINSYPEIFSFWLEEIIKQTKTQNFGDEQMIFINAWNEWAEGAHLEPDKQFGYAYLQAISDAVNKSC